MALALQKSLTVRVLRVFVSSGTEDEDDGWVSYHMSMQRALNIIALIRVIINSI